MSFIASLAFKNLFRYRRRTLITALAIAAGVSMYIFMDAWLQGAERESVRNLVKFETGSARVFHKTYWENREFLIPKYNLPDPAALEEALERAGYAVAPRVTVYANIRKAGGEGEAFDLQIAGVDPARDGRIFDLKNALKPGGRFLSPGAPEILLGQDVAARLDVAVGQSVELFTKTRDGIRTGLEARVAGVLATPDPIVNNAMGFVPLGFIQEALRMGEGVTDIVVGFPEWLDPAQETAKIASLVAGLPGGADATAKSYNDIAAEFGMIAQSKSGGSKVLLLLIFIIAAIGISNTMLMAIFERVREIGMMRALGMSDRAICASFFIEAMGIGLFGSFIGVSLGVLANLYMVNIGLDLSPLLSKMGNIGYRLAGVSKSIWNLSTIVIAGVGSVLFSGLIALLPARRALKKEITDCLRIK